MEQTIQGMVWDVSSYAHVQHVGMEQLHIRNWGHGYISSEFLNGANSKVIQSHKT